MNDRQETQNQASKRLLELTEEISRLKHDLKRQMVIANNTANENEEIRGDLKQLQAMSEAQAGFTQEDVEEIAELKKQILIKDCQIDNLENMIELLLQQSPDEKKAREEFNRLAEELGFYD